MKHNNLFLCFIRIHKRVKFAVSEIKNNIIEYIPENFKIEQFVKFSQIEVLVLFSIIFKIKNDYLILLFILKRLWVYILNQLNRVYYIMGRRHLLKQKKSLGLATTVLVII